MKLRSFPSSEAPPFVGSKSRRTARLERGWAPVELTEKGAYPFAQIDLRELEAIASASGPGRADSLTVLCWLKALTEGKAEKRTEVRVTDLEISKRAGLSPNTVAKAAAFLDRVGVVSVERRRGAKPYYLFTYPPSVIGKPPKCSPRNGELQGEDGAPEGAASPRNGERLPTTRGTVPHRVSTRSPNSEQGTEKSALRPAQQARSSVNQGSSGSLDSEGRCPHCRESTMAGFLEVEQPGGTVALTRCPGEGHRQARRPAAIEERRRAAREGS